MAYALFLDIDNTLLAKQVGIPKENIEALRRFHDAGHYVFINTGRTIGNYPAQALSPVPVDGVVASIGSYISFRGQELANRCMDPGQLIEVTMYFAKKGDRVIWEGDKAYRPFLLRDHPDRYRFEDAFDETFDLVAEAKAQRVSKITVLRQITPEEEAFLSRYFKVYVHSYYTETTFHGCDKGTGMLALCGHLGIPEDHIIAMGDSNNDEEMLRAAALSVAMGNSDPYLKELVTYVSCDAAQGGVAQGIYHFFPELRNNA
ncbi:MAG: HAD family phosphatase [Clostridia bacterium]|nr:HAD family phosphatase [Clostridia bacterium]